MTGEILSRQELARRWLVSVRTIDRLRVAGKLRWFDPTGGRGARPLVRFALTDVLQFEAHQHHVASGQPNGQQEPVNAE